VSAIVDDLDLDSFTTLADIREAFSVSGRRPRIFHGMGTMLGVFPYQDDHVHWLAWFDDGFQHAFSTRHYPDDVEMLEGPDDDTD
jgi:hypothetical protein